MASQEPVFVLLVTAVVKPGLLEKFKELFKPLADYVTDNEDGCLTYQLSVGKDNPNAICIFERYVSKQYLEDVHWKSDAFKKFGEQVRAADLWETKSAAKYWEEPEGAYGFMTRSSPHRPNTQAPVHVTIVTGSVKPGRMDDFKQAFKPLADHVSEHEKDGTLTYQLSVGADKPDDLCVYERYVSKDFLDNVHLQSDACKTFFATLQANECVEAMNITYYQEALPGEYGFVTRNK